MEKIMQVDSIIVKVNLSGVIGGPVEHTNRQRHTVALSEEFGGSMSRVIKHTDREQKECARVLQVPAKHVKSWLKDDSCPTWEKPGDWYRMSLVQRLQSHINSFDEGFGVSFEFLGDGGL